MTLTAIELMRYNTREIQQRDEAGLNAIDRTLFFSTSEEQEPCLIEIFNTIINCSIFEQIELFKKIQSEITKQSCKNMYQLMLLAYPHLFNHFARQGLFHAVWEEQINYLMKVQRCLSELKIDALISEFFASNLEFVREFCQVLGQAKEDLILAHKVPLLFEDRFGQFYDDCYKAVVGVNARLAIQTRRKGRCFYLPDASQDQFMLKFKQFREELCAYNDCLRDAAYVHVSVDAHV